MNKIISLTLVALFVSVAISGCASSGGHKFVNDESELPSVQEKYSSQLSKLEIGISLEDFRQVFPKAYVGSQNEKTTAYELVDVEKYVTQEDIDRQNVLWGFGSPKPQTAKRTLWFYFYDDKLVKWGRPQDWWENPYAINSRQGTYSGPSSREAEKERRAGTGTGFAISPNGHIVTACHILMDANMVKVYLSKESYVSAKILNRDPFNDLAVLKVEDATPNFLTVAPMRSVKTGDRVFTIGLPVSSLLGQEAKYTEGVVSSLSGIQGTSPFLQITVPVQPGNSGGPLVNEQGEVVGIVTSTAALLLFIKESGSLPQNVNWAVKADYLRSLIELPKTEKTQLNREQAITLAKNSTFIIEVE